VPGRTASKHSGGGNVRIANLTAALNRVSWREPQCAPVAASAAGLRRTLLEAGVIYAAGIVITFLYMVVLVFGLPWSATGAGTKVAETLGVAALAAVSWLVVVVQFIALGPS
jgi:hypothetical protein